MSEPLEYMLFDDLQPVLVLLSPQCFLMIVSAFLLNAETAASRQLQKLDHAPYFNLSSRLPKDL